MLDHPNRMFYYPTVSRVLYKNVTMALQCPGMVLNKLILMNYFYIKLLELNRRF